MFVVEKQEGGDRVRPPVELRPMLLGDVPAVVEDTVEAIRTQGGVINGEAHVLERNLALGISDAIERWFDGAQQGPHSELHFALGRAHARAGRSLEELMGFYRSTAQMMWRTVCGAGAACGIAPADLYRLAETGFGCVEELSSQAANGFSEESSLRSGASQSRRSELVRLLLAEPQPPLAALRELASSVGVELGGELALFVGAADRCDAFTTAAREHVVLGPRGEEFIGVLPDPADPAARERLAAAAASANAALALGPAVEPAAARTSLKRARQLRTLARAGLVESGPLVEAERHDVALLLSAEPSLALELAQRALAPLNAVRGESTRRNLALTLHAWLRSPGQRKAIAHSLGVHPQTVRYRMSRLRELFGAALDDPDRRFELQLALRVQPYAELPAAEPAPDAA